MSRDARERALNSAAEAERLFRWMVDRAPAIFWTTDRDLKITSSVGGGLVALGLAPGQMVGTSMSSYFGSEDPDHPVTSAHRVALKGEPARYEIAWGGQVYRARVEPVRDPAGDIVGVVGLALDLTDARRSALVERA